MILASEEKNSCAGFWHPPGSADAIEATLVGSDNGSATISYGDTISRFERLKDIEISVRVAGIPRRLQFPDGSIFETRDNDFIDALLRSSGQRRDFIHELERFRPRLVAFAVAICVLSYAIYRFALPVLVEVAIWATPDSVPRLISAAALETLDQAVLKKSTLPEQQKERLHNQFNSLVDLVDNQSANYNLNFRKGGVLGPNALALPDGTIVVTDELIRMVKNDEAVLGVLAHEIGHTELKHSLRQLYNVAGSYALIMLIAGDIGSGVEEVLLQGRGLLALSYSRQAEKEADRFSVALMAKAGHNPRSINIFFSLLGAKFKDESKTSIFSTHPSSPERKKAVDEYAETLR